MMTGERIMTAAFGAFGVLWIIKSLKLSYWSDFAPGPGFLPFWLGIAIVALSTLLLWQSFIVEGAAAQASGPARPGRVVAISLGFIICIAVLTFVGFVMAIAGYLAFLIGWVERRPPLQTAVMSVATSVILWGIFKGWLSVPLPAGPWGF
jgi:putative tricarboxylic transport membrane protein